ncbi:hypothetical protein HDA32_000478 [Spinactinospora alkalitolerans]|uniref:DUF3592 domain-containing protein n=1 Tax=Spinactinospora alkalitolerans TaxID=687207 RepID=A0A852TN41_9ACTN|nr:DUF3592 domain-containing protein [Spinactinospora alkalitolerans]NYE45358.1 hypothetical protein [Spinactinospora alkalitolerans]
MRTPGFQPHDRFHGRRPPYRSSGGGGAVRIVGAIIAGVFGLILLILGVVFTLVGGLDYTDHTGRADAVVVDRVETTSRDSDGDLDTDVDVYVSYEAEGRTHEHVALNGLNPSDHHEGEELTVAYHPDDPGDPVTAASTESGAFDLFGYIGVPMIVAAVLLFITSALILLLGRRR